LKCTAAAAAAWPILLLVADPVFIGIDEKLSVVLSKTGGLESLEIQGTMSLVVGSDADAYVSVKVGREMAADDCCTMTGLRNSAPPPPQGGGG
jgi:hypothetical protein